ncbi:MAG: hypothetical protein M0C28_27690 [Candidatus Moduliflexus flocculans]|nr:hypothetical protein [Candidatus Moduliflexus flocculans]
MSADTSANSITPRSRPGSSAKRSWKTARASRSTITRFTAFTGKPTAPWPARVRTERGAFYDFYDRGWKNKLPYSKTSLLADRHIPRPEAYDEIIEAAEKLSKPFPFVRADFYSVRGRAKFGEMTFTPHACIDTNMTDLAQDTMGDLLELPEQIPRMKVVGLACEARAGLKKRQLRLRIGLEAAAGADGSKGEIGRWGDRDGPDSSPREEASPFGKTQTDSDRRCPRAGTPSAPLWCFSRSARPVSSASKTGGRLFHPGRARTFEDKLRWLMLYWREPLKSQCADKYAVRSYVTERGLGHLLPELLGVYESGAEIDFSSLPEKFALKCTHGSGLQSPRAGTRPGSMSRQALKMLDRWMKTDISKSQRGGPLRVDPAEDPLRDFSRRSVRRLDQRLQDPLFPRTSPLHDGLHRTGPGDAQVEIRLLRHFLGAQAGLLPAGLVDRPRYPQTRRL